MRLFSFYPCLIFEPQRKSAAATTATVLPLRGRSIAASAQLSCAVPLHMVCVFLPAYALQVIMMLVMGFMAIGMPMLMVSETRVR